MVIGQIKSTVKILFFFISFIFLCVSQVTATMPMPSNVKITGCVLNNNFFLIREYENNFLSMEKYDVVLDNGAFDYVAYEGKIINGIADMMNLRNKKISIRTGKFRVDGSCLPLAVKGCVVDGKFFLTESHLGSLTVKHYLLNSFDSVHPVAVLTGNNIPYDLSSMEKKTLLIGVTSAQNDSKGISGIKVREGSVQVISPCNPSDSYWLREGILNDYKARIYESIKEGNFQEAVRAMKKSIAFANPYYKCSSYLVYYRNELKFSNASSAVYYAYNYACCSGKMEVLEELETKFAKEKESAYAAFTVALAAELENNAEAKRMLMERFREYERQINKNK